MEGYGGLERQLDFSTALENRKRVPKPWGGGREQRASCPAQLFVEEATKHCNYPHDYKEEEEEEEEEEEVADGGSCGGSYGGGGADGGGGGGGGGGCSSSLYSTLNRSLRVS
ncbi:hypothetical protein HZH68_003467 [Vespula germanica]|uniref:Uncharacterized protein n=1 Tax=Vespula germanica TaxID=30212 RepID=A0A834NP73_VESGE|nr:hypothetical protein HZH68_003467 [Vespula germanica]